MRITLLYTAAGIILLSAGAHGILGWKAQSEALRQLNAPADLMGGLAAGWYFGSAAMLAFGAILIAAARRLARGDRAIAPFVGPIAAVYILYGLGAFVWFDFEPHFFVFVVPGVLAAIPLFHRRG